MPKIYRSMYEDAGLPTVGADNCELGVRPPGHPVNADVTVDAANNVVLDGKGMSVFPSITPAVLKKVPKRLIPLRLADRVPGAIGDDDMKIWTLVVGPFAAGAVAANLVLNVTSPTHGAVCPANVMSLPALQASLADTQPDWTVDEP